jgi:hypothetical protein
MTYRSSKYYFPSCSDALVNSVKPKDKENKILHDCHVVICDLPNITFTQIAYFTGIVGMYRFSATVSGAGVATALQLRLFAILLILLWKI